MNFRLRSLIGLGVTVLLVLAAVLVVLGRSGGDMAPPNVGTLEPRREGCTEVDVVASSEKSALLTKIAQEYNASGQEVGGNCVDVAVTSLASGTVAASLANGWNENVDGPRPDVWSPAATSWLKVSRQQSAAKNEPSVVPEEGESIAQSPLVLAMPEPMARALGWPDAPIGWSDVLALSTAPAGWGAVGHPEWGAFKLGKTNPNISTSGLHATVGAYVAATDVSSDLSPANLAKPAVQTYVAGVESSVVHYGDTTLTFLGNLQRADSEGRGLSYISAVAVEEKSVWDYNQGNPSGDPETLGEKDPPQVPLVAVYPEEGTLVSDSPFAVLRAEWVTAQKQAAAANFLAHLRTPAVQAQFQEVGFRSFEGTAGAVADDPANGLTANQSTAVLSPAAGEVLTRVVDDWSNVRKKARALLVIDVSDSMEEGVGSSSKLELAKKAALGSLDQFSPEDEVGLWIFSTERDGTRPYLELVPVGRIGDNADQLRERIRNLTRTVERGCTPPLGRVSRR